MSFIFITLYKRFEAFGPDIFIDKRQNNPQRRCYLFQISTLFVPLSTLSSNLKTGIDSLAALDGK